MPRASPASLAGALLAGALLLAAAAAPARAQPAPPAPVRVGFLLGQGSEPFTYLTPDGTPAGFEVELMRQLCAGAGLVCAFTPLPSLEDRIVALVNGSVDASIGQLSFTPGRAEVVSFVRPFYYSTGTVLLVSRPANAATSLSGGPRPAAPVAPAAAWRALAGQRVCFLRGYYATLFIVQKYRVEPVEVGSVDEGVRKAKGNGCEAFAFVSHVTAEGVEGLQPLANVAPIYVTPYGIAVAQGNKALSDALSLGLVGAMAAGNASALAQLERRELVAKGVPPLGALSEVIRAITSFSASDDADDRVPASYSSIFGSSLAG